MIFVSRDSDPARATPSNPILVELRFCVTELWEPEWLPESAAEWIELLDEDPEARSAQNWGPKAGTFTPEQIEHARKVLARLAVLS